MTEAQRFMFDVQGYLVLEGVLAPDRVQRMLRDFEKHVKGEPENATFLGFLQWGEDWRSLIDEPALLPVLAELLGPQFRLDHAYGMAMTTQTQRGGEGFHNQAAMFSSGCYYVTNGQAMHNGLIVVSYALTDIAPGVGGFCCVPGSHKANFKMPAEWFTQMDNPLARQVPQKAGDVLIFTESLTHGTLRWTDPRNLRRSVLMKYCPGYMQWAPAPVDAGIESLSDRQRRILQGPRVASRPSSVEI